jgi:hypothetical protein
MTTFVDECFIARVAWETEGNWQKTHITVLNSEDVSKVCKSQCT